jgi:hypothetical protein
MGAQRDEGGVEWVDRATSLDPRQDGPASFHPEVSSLKAPLPSCRPGLARGSAGSKSVLALDTKLQAAAAA